MRIGQFVAYKGYIGSIEYDPEDNYYYGKLLNTDDFVNYHANSIIELEEYYHKAINNYIDFKKEISNKG